MRICGWLLLLFAWGAVQLPMAWCDQSGMHPEIPVGHDDHDHEEAHESVDVDLVLVSDDTESAAPVEACIEDAPVLARADGPAATVERAAAPPGRLSTVRLL